MSSRLRLAVWFAVPFVVVLAVLTGMHAWLGARISEPRPPLPSSLPDTSRLVGQAFPANDLIEAQSRAAIETQGLAVPDTAVIILLGGASCSPNQVKLLRYWSEHHAETGLRKYPLLAVYTDPLLGVEQGAFEMLALRRLSQADFPFLVSQNPDFSPRTMGVPTPQVVLVESYVITHVLDLPDEFQPLSFSSRTPP